MRACRPPENEMRATEDKNYEFRRSCVMTLIAQFELAQSWLAAQVNISSNLCTFYT
jgi:hypothetical protein